jgi:tetratricopeptide (TPR) repeat protein
VLQAAVIALAVSFVFAQVVRGGWLWDDGLEITDNFALRSPSGLRRLWLSPPGLDYFPLKGTVQWLQWHLWLARPAGYHATSVAAHLAGALLLWRVLAKIGVRLAWLGGLLFAVHPLTVESVAWVAEFKNVLSLPFLLLAIGAYIDWDKGAQAKRALPYLTALLCFLASLLCKTSGVMLPFVLLLYCWWKRGRITRRELRASAPFFAVSLALGSVTFWFQSHRAIASLVGVEEGFPVRMAAAGRAIVFYFVKAAWPSGLLPIYPRWEPSHLGLRQFWPWVLVVGVPLGLWRLSRPERPAPPRPEQASDAIPLARHVLLGLGFFLLNLVPVLGLVPMAYMRISRVADHFAYVPLVGLVGLFAAGVGAAWGAAQPSKPRMRGAVLLSAALVVAALAMGARRYAAIFRDEKTLWTYTLARNPQAWIGYNNLGIALAMEGRRDEAMALYGQSLRLRPDFAEAHNNLGIALAGAGRLEEALAHYERAIRSEPGFAGAYNNEGNVLLREGRLAEAIGCFERALRFNPDFADAHNDLGNALSRAGRAGEAIVQYERALALDPGLVEAQSNLGAALASVGNLPAAIEHYESVLRLRPDFAEAHNNLGVALAQVGRDREAADQYRLALRYQPGMTEALANLKRLEKKSAAQGGAQR